MIGPITFALRFSSMSAVNLTEKCETLTLTIACTETCKYTYDAWGWSQHNFSINSTECRCLMEVDGEWKSCCYVESCPTATTPTATTPTATTPTATTTATTTTTTTTTTATTTTKTRGTCYPLASMADCRQACMDLYNDASGLVFKHREECINPLWGPCCDGVENAGARALSLLPAAMIPMSVLVARLLG